MPAICAGGDSEMIRGRMSEDNDMEIFMMEIPRRTGRDVPSGTVKCCDRCAMRAVTLFFDDLTLQDLCKDCCDWLRRRRGTTSFFAITKKI